MFISEEANDIQTGIMELKKVIPDIPKIYLCDYIRCAKEYNGRYKIGILNRDVDGMTSFKKGDLVLFEPYSIQDNYGKMAWDDIKIRITRCTVCIPCPRDFKNSKDNGFILGTVQWYGAWRCYAFYPNGNTVFELICLKDITSFIENLMNERKLNHDKVPIHNNQA